MNINLTETEALTIADFLVNAITAINGLQKPLIDEQQDFVKSSNEFIVQTWTQANEQDKQMIIEEHQKKLKNGN